MRVQSQVQEHIGTIAKHEQEFLARRSRAERLGDLTAAVACCRRRLALDPLLRTATGHLVRGWRYLQNIPLSEREVRLFLAYSLFFAVRTLALAQEKPARPTPMP